MMDHGAMRKWLERLQRRNAGTVEEWTLSQRTESERVTEIVVEVEAFCRSLQTDWRRK